MRQSDESTLIGPINIGFISSVFSNKLRIDESPENKLFKMGLEALLSHKDRDNMFLKVELRSAAFRIDKIDVYSEFESVSTMSIHHPDGSERNNPQLQIKFSYDVQQRKPRNVKRSLNPKAIAELVSMIKPMPEIELTAHCLGQVEEFATTSVRNSGMGIESVNSLLRELYYRRSEDQVRVMESLLSGGDGMLPPKEAAARGVATSYRQAFTDAFAQLRESQAQYKELVKDCVMVVESPGEKFTAVRHTVTDGNRDCIVTKYVGKDTLPPHVIGGMAVLDILSEYDDRSNSFKSVPGVALQNGRMQNVFIILGSGSDTGSQGQGPSN
jgi:hypothetical protein